MLEIVSKYISKIIIKYVFKIIIKYVSKIIIKYVFKIIFKLMSVSTLVLGFIRHLPPSIAIIFWRASNALRNVTGPLCVSVSFGMPKRLDKTHFIQPLLCKVFFFLIQVIIFILVFSLSSVIDHHCRSKRLTYWLFCSAISGHIQTWKKKVRKKNYLSGTVCTVPVHRPLSFLQHTLQTLAYSPWHRKSSSTPLRLALFLYQKPLTQLSSTESSNLLPIHGRMSTGKC